MSLSNRQRRGNERNIVFHVKYQLRVSLPRDSYVLQYEYVTTSANVEMGSIEHTNVRDL